MAVWKQILMVAALAAAGLYAWAYLDPNGRDQLAGWGVPAWALPAAEETVAAGAGSAPGETPRALPGGQAAGQQGGRQGQQGGRQGQGGGRGGFGGPAPVTTAAVGEAITNDRVSAIGTAGADKSVTIFPRSAGVVEEVLFKPGETVASGDLLVRLDSDAEVIALEQAEVALRDARAKLARYEALATNQSISSVERDTARSEVAAADLAVREAQLDLERRTIRAPYEGIVGLSEIEIGDLLSTSTAITSIDDRSTLKIEFRIPEVFAAKVALDQTISATTPSRPGETFTGVVSAIGSRIEADSRTLVVRADIPNRDDLLRPGMSFFVTLRFDGDPRLSVPALSVQWDREGSYVWKVADGKVSRAGVTILERNAETVLVAGEIAKDDIVVVEGVQRLRPGAAITDTADAGRSQDGAPTEGSIPPQARRG